jgi:hypothetical protein
LEALSFDELRARALGVIDAVERESPGVGVFVVLVQTLEGGTARYAAESTYDQEQGAELLRLVGSAWGQV